MDVQPSEKHPIHSIVSLENYEEFRNIMFNHTLVGYVRNFLAYAGYPFPYHEDEFPQDYLIRNRTLLRAAADLQYKVISYPDSPRTAGRLVVMNTISEYFDLQNLHTQALEAPDA